MFGQKTLEKRALAGRATMLRDSISLLRRDAEMCQASVNQDEAGFQDLAMEVDSMRTGVRSFEDSGPEGREVPADEYVEYLTAFDEYNEAVEGWDNRADRLEARAVVCRRLFVQHNVLVDTLRVLADRLSVK